MARLRAFDRESVEALLTFGGAFLLCLVLRLWTLSDNFWELELVAADTIERGWGGMLADRIGYAEPPLYYILLKLLGLAGSGNFGLRLPSAILDSLACALLASVAAQASGRIGAIAFALTFSFMPVLLRFGQEARPYPLLCFFFALALVAATEVWRSPLAAGTAFSPGNSTLQRQMRLTLGILSIALIGAGWTMVIGWLVVAAFLASVLVVPRLWRVPGFVRTWLIVSGVVWLTTIPVILLVAPHFAHFWETLWVPDPYPVTIGGLFGEIRGSFGWTADGDRNHFFPAGWEGWLGLALVAVAIGSVARRRPPPPLRQVTFIAVVVTLVLFVAHMVRPLTPLRYIQPALWCLCLLYADGAAVVARRGAVAGRAVLAILAIGVVLQGIDGEQAERKANWTPFLDFFIGTQMEALHGYVTDPGLELAITRSLPEGTPAPSIDLILDPAEFRAAVAGAMSREAPIWILTARPAQAILAGLPAGIAQCSTQISYHTFFILARQPTAFPPQLQGCLAGRQNVR